MNEPTISIPEGINPAEILETHKCPKCPDKAFASANALRMHNMRMHTAGGGKGYKWRQKLTRLDHLERRRLYQKKLRDRYYKEGRNSKGELMPAGWKPNRNRQDGAAKRYNSKSYTTTLTGKRREIYLAKQRKYQKNHYAKKRAERLEAQEPQVPIPDNSPVRIYGDAASAIVLAANVIRAVTTGLKISNQ